MLQLMQRLVNRRNDEKGASAVEYGLLVAAIAALIVIIVFALGGVVKEVFTDTCDRSIEGQHLGHLRRLRLTDAEQGVGATRAHPLRLLARMRGRMMTRPRSVDETSAAPRAVEYGLIVVAIAALIVAIVFAPRRRRPGDLLGLVRRDRDKAAPSATLLSCSGA